MELINGETLETRIMRDGAIPAKEALRIAVKISEALNHAWTSQKLTHGDIKPDNVILDSSGVAKLADLGLAKFQSDDHSTTGLMATPLYAPPEIIRGEIDKISSQSDMYSFGVTLYQMLTGTTPFKDGAPDVVLKQHINDKPPLISEYNAKFAPALIQIVSQLLEKNFYDRPYAWSDITKALKKIKEPEIEGKIFHTHQQSEIGSHEHKEYKPVEKSKKNKSMILLMFFLFLFLLILVAAVVIVGNSDNKKDKSVTEETFAVKTANQEFLKIRKEREYDTTAQSIVKIEALMAKYGKDTPNEAVVVLEELKKKLDKNKGLLTRRQLAKKSFKKDLSSVLTKISTFNFNAENIAIKKVKLLSNEIENVLKIASSHSTSNLYRIEVNDRKILNDAYFKLSSLITKINTQLAKIALQKRTSKKLALIKQEKLKNDKIERKRQEGLHLSRTIDSYYEMLSSYLKDRDVDELSANITNWEKSNTIIPAGYSLRVDLLKKLVLPNWNKCKDTLIKHESLIIGKPLPKSASPIKYRKYNVTKINDLGIKLTLSDGKVSLGRTLKWKKISAKIVAAIVKESLVSDISNLSKSDSISIVAFILLRGSSCLELVIDDLPHINSNQIGICNLLASDFKIAKLESKLISRYSELKEDYKNNDLFDASEKIIKILQISKNTLFLKRYSQELNLMLKKLSSINPAIDANELLAKCEKIVNSSSSAMEKLNLIMVAKARFGKLYDDNKKIKELQKSIVNQVIRESEIDDLAANRVPFYYWELEKTGDAWAYYQLIKKSGRLKSMSKILVAMELAAAIDIGDWSLAKNLYDSGNSLDVEQLLRMKKTQNWAASFIFARGIIDQQFGEGHERQNVLTSLIGLANPQKISAMTPMITALAMEYAMLVGQSNRARGLGSKYKYRLKRMSKVEARVALLYLLSLLNSDPVSSKTVNATIIQINKSFARNIVIKNNDLVWVREAFKLFAGTFNQNSLNILTKTKCLYPDIAARIMTTAIALRYSSTPTRLNTEIEKSLLLLIRKNIKSNIVANQSWKKFTLLKIALQRSPKAMITEIDRALKEYEISTTPFYAHLIFMKSALMVSVNKLKKSEAQANLTNFFNASEVSSLNDIAMLDIFNTTDFHSPIGAFYIKNFVNEGNLYAILAIILNRKNSNVLNQVKQVLNENKNLLSPEEEFLINQIK